MIVASLRAGPSTRVIVALAQGRPLDSSDRPSLRQTATGSGETGVGAGASTRSTALESAACAGAAPGRCPMKPKSQRDAARDTLSREVGYVRKPHDGRLRVALAFPNTYFVGMSNLGFQTIYRLFNDQPDIVCERVFLPPKQELKQPGRVGRAHRVDRVADADSRLRRLRVFGLVRVGLHERPDAAAPGRPARARSRSHARPPAGADWRRGDVRQPRAARAVRRRDRRRRGRGADSPAGGRDAESTVARATCSRLLAPTRGFYIPSFYDVEYAADGTIARYVPKPGTGAPPVVRKAAIKTTEAVDPPSTSIFTPDTEFGSRFLIEVVRGCANLCRFCWAGYNYLPVRAFSTERILELARAARPHCAHAPGSCRSRSATTPRSNTSFAA